MQTTHNCSEYDFPVELQPIYTKLGTKLPRNQAVVRTDTQAPISVVSSIYNLITHKEVLDAVVPFMQKFGAGDPDVVVERDGARIVATWRFLDRTLATQAGDKIGLTVHAINSYDKTGSVIIRVGGVVLRCMNGMTAVHDEFSLYYRHSGKKIELEMPDPEIVWGQFVAGTQFWSALEQHEISPDFKTKLIELALERKVASETSLEADAVSSQIEASKTAWDLYNAFTYAITHESKTRNRTTEILRQDKLNRLFKSAYLPAKV